MRQREQGVSLVELTVTMALLMVISMIAYTSFIGSMRTAQFLESRGDLLEYGQKALNGLKSEITQGRYMFENDAVGASYLARLQIPAGLVPETDTRLPIVDTNGTLVPDVGGQTRVGNALMLGRQLDPLTVAADVNGDGTTDTALADRYEFLYVFTARNNRKRFRPEPFFLDLVAMRSAAFADYFQLQGLSSTARTQVAAALYAEGVRKAWNPGQAATSGFYNIAMNGTLTLDPDPVIPVAGSSLFPQFAGGRVAGEMTYSVGMTRSPAIASPDPVSMFGIPNGRFPGGFEVLAVGPPGARKIHLRLCLLASYADKINSQVTTVTATVTQM